MPDKLIFEVVKPKVTEKESQIMRVSKDLYNLLNEISTNTGLSIVKVSERIADFLDGKVIIKDREEA